MTKRQYVGALVVLAVAGLVGGTLSDWARGRSAYAQEGIADAIEARQLIVRDEAGYARIQLGISGVGNAFIRINSRLGQPKLELREDSGHPYLLMVDGPDAARAPREAEPDVLLATPPFRLWMGTGEDELPSLRMYDETGTCTWSAP